MNISEKIFVAVVVVLALTALGVCGYLMVKFSSPQSVTAEGPAAPGNGQDKQMLTQKVKPPTADHNDHGATGNPVKTNDNAGAVKQDAGGISGLVKLSDTGAAAVGVNVEAFWFDGQLHAAATGITGSDGRFALSGVPPGANCWVIVTANGYAQATKENIEVSPLQTADAGEILLSKGTEVSGSVMDERHKPIAGAAVSLHRTVNVGGKTSTKQPAGNTQSDAEGKFTFANLSPGSYSACAEKAGYALGWRHNIHVGKSGRPGDLRIRLVAGK
jgi:hypothetical protein